MQQGPWWLAGVLGAAGLMVMLEPQALTPATALLTLIVGLAAGTLMADQRLAPSLATRLQALAGGALIAALYGAWHRLLAPLAAAPDTLGVADPRLWLVLTLFVGLFLLHSLLALRPQSSLARTLYPHFFAGLYLDELFTRFTLQLWPQPSLRRHKNPLPRTDALTDPGVTP